MLKAYPEQAARIADGFGFYSWNEMVDTHVVPDPEPPLNPNSRITRPESDAAISSLGSMAKRFIGLAGR